MYYLIDHDWEEKFHSIHRISYELIEVEHRKIVINLERIPLDFSWKTKQMEIQDHGQSLTVSVEIDSVSLRKAIPWGYRTIADWLNQTQE